MNDESIDYKEMYLKMARAAEKAINLLIEAQQECEALYVEACREDDSLPAAGCES